MAVIEAAIVSVIKCRADLKNTHIRDPVCSAFKLENIRFLGLYRVNNSKPMVWTQNSLVKCRDNLETIHCEKLICDHE